MRGIRGRWGGPWYCRCPPCSMMYFCTVCVAGSYWWKAANKAFISLFCRRFLFACPLADGISTSFPLNSRKREDCPVSPSPTDRANFSLLLIQYGVICLYENCGPRRGFTVTDQCLRSLIKLLYYLPVLWNGILWMARQASLPISKCGESCFPCSVLGP